MKPSSIMSALLALAVLAASSACTKREDPVGPAQKAGAAIDNAGDKVAEQVQENLRRAEQASRDIADKARATGDQITDATRDATKDASAGLEKATEEVGKKVERAGERIQEAAK